ncbi:Hypothetical protein mma_1708 [Janthinobacterium sp. Marseille]|nr:acyltransferase family protein [Janthinobacterium sp. Marseille]ABR91570.1 Hypothetical protein mma_1708 [Janthinobacterium sp. Marseille]
MVVEEQFYLVWPLVVWFVYKRKFSLFAIISILLAASFLLGIATIKSHPAASFFLPVTRLWELLAGAALAYLSVQGRQIKGETYQNLVSLVGLFLLSYGIFRLSATGFPGVKGLVPVIGALCLIAAGPGAWLNRHILGSRLFVGIGLISYPLYLWHWPLLSFARILEAGTPSPAIRAAIVGISFILAILTFLLLERPLKRIAATRLMPILLTLLLSVGATGALIYWKDGVASRFANDQNALFVRGDYFGGLDIRDCGKEFSKVASTHCRTTDSPTVAIFGDSHTAHLFYGMAIQPRDNAVMMLLGGACPPAKGVEVRPGCTQQYEDALRMIASTPTIQTVILVAYYAYSDDEAMRKKMLAGYRQTIADLKGKKVIFLADTPTLKVSAETCFTRPVRLSSHALEKCDLPKSAFDSSRVIYNDFVKSIGEENQSVRVFDPTPLFCNTQVCEAVHDGKLQYTDNNHLSRDGGRRLAEWLDVERSRLSP